MNQITISFIKIFGGYVSIDYKFIFSFKVLISLIKFSIISTENIGLTTNYHHLFQEQIFVTRLQTHLFPPINYKLFLNIFHDLTCNTGMCNLNVVMYSSYRWTLLTAA